MYPELNSTLVGSNIMETFIYANSVTGGYFGLIITIAFFLVVFLGSVFMQQRFTTQIKIETSLLASCFATLGWATVLEMTSGILSPVYFFILIGLTILSFIWVALGD
ncbi:MAG: hypothetical protein M0R03_22840 [Novosphingobium sp.]|nr:hypothetical protein [Novosphingobium sp.]